MLRYRFLFEQLVRRELRARYKGSALGLLWYLVNPLLLMAVYGLIFGVFIKSAPTSEHDYLLFLFVGLIVWLFFSQALLAAGTALTDQAALVSRVRFPRVTIPASVVTVQMLTFCALLLLVLPVCAGVRGILGAPLLLLVPLVICLYAFVLGVCLVASILHAYFRDVHPILSALLLPWFFLTPIYFVPEKAPGVAGSTVARIFLEWVNPIAPFIRALRAVVYGGAYPTAGELVYVAVAAILALSAGQLLFRRLESELAVVL